MLCHAESFRVSRMRETRPSGLMRAEAAALLPLRYSTDTDQRPECRIHGAVRGKITCYVRRNEYEGRDLF